MRHIAPADAAASQATIEENLPTWDLGGLHRGPESPAVQADLAKAEQAAVAFAAAHQGKLAAMSGGVLAAVIAEYERIEVERQVRADFCHGLARLSAFG